MMKKTIIPVLATLSIYSGSTACAPKGRMHLDHANVNALEDCIKDARHLKDEAVVAKDWAKLESVNQISKYALGQITKKELDANLEKTMSYAENAITVAENKYSVCSDMYNNLKVR